MSGQLKVQKRIFFADDDKYWADAMMGLLANRGFQETKSCNMASNVISEATAFRPDVLLVDIRWDKATPGDPQEMQGDDILRIIQEQGLFRGVFIAALTKELSAEEVAFQQVWKGKYPIIKKSKDPDDLLAALRQLNAL